MRLFWLSFVWLVLWAIGAVVATGSNYDGKCKVCAEPPGAMKCESGQNEIEGLVELLSTEGEEYTLPVTQPPSTSDAGSTSTPTAEGEQPQVVAIKLSEIALLVCQNTYEVIPSSIGRLSRLRSMTFESINVSLSIPTEVGRLEKLTSMVFESATKVSRLPTQLGLLSNLDLLRFQRTMLTGTLPTQLGKLVNLTALDLSYNDLSPSPFPKALASMTALTQLDLSGASIYGNVAPDLSQLTNLEFLVLRDNLLNTTLTSGFWSSFSKLSFLDIANNALVGNLNQFTTLNAKLLKVLDIEQNQVTGSIPEEFGSFVDITGLSLSSNLLTGNLPVVLGNLRNLRECTASSNSIGGPIPDSLGRLVNLNNLRLDNNLLTGTIPASLSNLNQLTSVYLLGSGNDLDGPVPENLWNEPGRVDSDLTEPSLPSPFPVVINQTIIPTPGQTELVDVTNMSDESVSLAVLVSFIVLGVCVVLTCCGACYFRPKSTTTEERVPIKRSPQPSMSQSPAQIQLA